MTEVVPRAGFIGLGNAGEPMARQILSAGLPLTVFDIDPAPVGRLVQEGARRADSAQHVGEACDVIAINVASEGQLEAVMGEGGTSGLLGAARRGTVICVHSTVSPAACRRLADVSRARGVGLLDVGFSVRDHGDSDRPVTLLVGGAADDLDRARPVLSAYGRKIFHLGGVGCGMAAKLVNNVLVYDAMQAIAEALGLARKAGIEESLMLEVLTACSGDSWVVRNWDVMGHQRGYSGGAARVRALAAKDLAHAVSYGGEVGTLMPLTQHVADLVASWFIPGGLDAQPVAESPQSAGGAHP
jgi:3-hydroxyisobutyrate dehydrogenase-like beta-hydroxyacid dehydrogenase